MVFELSTEENQNQAKEQLKGSIAPQDAMAEDLIETTIVPQNFVFNT